MEQSSIPGSFSIKTAYNDRAKCNFLGEIEVLEIEIWTNKS
jgi:hypothetical protein